MIDFTKSQQYTLSIRLSTDGFSFSIYNPIHDNSLSTIEKETDTSLSLTANLKATFRESDFLNHSYRRVNIMMADKRFTIVPLELFEEEQAELRQEADFHDVAVARQRHDHTDDEHNGEHVNDMERPTPTERVGHPCADRHAHHGCDGEAGEHPCDEFRTESVRCHIGRVRHSHSHQRSGYQGDHDARHHQNRVVGRERA